MLTALRNRWYAEGGYQEILKIAIPLVLSTGSVVIQHFVDRMFLAWHSAEAVAAATPAGLISYTLMSIFIGTATYVNTFVAQYSGAQRNRRIGPAVWQGLYFALFAGLAVLPLYPLAATNITFNINHLVFLPLAGTGMAVSVTLSWLLMVIPSYLAIVHLQRGLYTVWIFHTLNMIVLGLVFLRRFQGGKWKNMRVIESTPPSPDMS